MIQIKKAQIGQAKEEANDLSNDVQKPANLMTRCGGGGGGGRRGGGRPVGWLRPGRNGTFTGGFYG